jgi:hypothetical protein
LIKSNLSCCISIEFLLLKEVSERLSKQTIILHKF